MAPILKQQDRRLPLRLYADAVDPIITGSAEYYSTEIRSVLLEYRRIGPVGGPEMWTDRSVGPVNANRQLPFNPRSSSITRGGKMDRALKSKEKRVARGAIMFNAPRPKTSHLTWPRTKTSHPQMVSDINPGMVVCR